MNERANELARQLFGVDADNTTPAVVQAVNAARDILIQYGREVRQQSLNAINQAYLPGLPDIADPYQTGLRTGGNDALSMLAMDIKGRPLP